MKSKQSSSNTHISGQPVVSPRTWEPLVDKWNASSDSVVVARKAFEALERKRAPPRQVAREVSKVLKSDSEVWLGGLDQGDTLFRIAVWYTEVSKHVNGVAHESGYSLGNFLAAEYAANELCLENGLRDSFKRVFVNPDVFDNMDAVADFFETARGNALWIMDNGAWLLDGLVKEFDRQHVEHHLHTEQFSADLKFILGSAGSNADLLRILGNRLWLIGWDFEDARRHAGAFDEGNSVPGVKSSDLFMNGLKELVGGVRKILKFHGFSRSGCF